jgi:hypothetical protein
VLRVVVFLQRRPLWIDEAMIALNVGRLTPGRLLAPLEWDQVAPIGWIVLERTLVLAFGMHEWALRLPALVAGILTPWLVWLVARRWVGNPAALVATVLVATNAALLYHANEVKPYAFDALIAIALLGLAGRVLIAETGAARQHAWWRLGLCGVLGTLFSLPAILVLAGLGVVLLGVALHRRDRRMSATAVGVGALWLSAFVPLWLVSYRPATLDPIMRAFWFDAMAGLGSPGVRERVGDLVNQTARLVTTAPPWHAWPIVLALVTIGASLLWVRGHRHAVLLLMSPIAVLGLGWLTDQVAVGVRVSLWAVPSLTILGGWAITTLGATARWTRAVAGVLVVALATTGAVEGVRRDSANGGRDLIAGVLAAQPAVVYLSAGAIPQWLVTSTDWARPDTTRLDVFADLGSAGGPLFHNPMHRRLEAIVPDRGDGPVPREMLGRPAGMRIEYGGRRDLVPIPGWGDAEGQRIALAVDQGVHVLLIFAQPAEQGALFRGLRAANVPIHHCGTERRAWWWYVGSNPPTHCTTLYTPDPS